MNESGEFARRHVCLVIAPFDDAFEPLFDALNEAVTDAGMRAIRADRIPSFRPIRERFVDQLERASYVIADITEPNSNVGYEIGIAHALGRPVLFVSSGPKTERVPFYFVPHPVIHFDRSAQGLSQLRETVKMVLRTGGELTPMTESLQHGMTAFFEDDTGAFRECMLRGIRSTEREMVFVGWGLAFLLSQQRDLIRVIRNRIREHEELRVAILLPRPDHPGLRTRIKEEAAMQQVAIMDDWPTKFFEYALELREGLDAGQRERTTVSRISYLPTATVVRLDGVYFFRPYGPPKKGGWASPWFRFLADSCHASWRGYLANMVDDALADEHR